MTYWPTSDEKKFLWGLGSHSKAGKDHTISHLELLLGYRQSMRSRSNWGQIDKGEIEQYVAELIAQEEKAAA